MSNLARRLEQYNMKINPNVKKTLKQIDLIHKNDDGFITIGIKNKLNNWHQWHYKKEELTEEVISYFIEIGQKNDVYISYNSFYKPVRNVENIRHLNALYVDIDKHNNKIEKDDIEALLWVLEMEYFNIRFPRPSIIYKTGRGLQFALNIEHLPKQALPLWQLLENKIVEELKELDVRGFSVDINCTDAARVGRLVETKNTKSKTKCKILDFNESVYRLDEIIDGYFPELQIIKRKTKKDKTEKEKKVVNLYNLYSLHHARLLDIIKLRDIRNGECKGHREFLCFLYRYYSILYSGEKHKALEDTLEFNKGFKKPLEKIEIIKATKSAEKAFTEWLKKEKNNFYKRGGYNYSNSTLIKKLEITHIEQKSLKTIIGKEEKNRRKNIANKKMYKESRRNINGLTQKQQELEEQKKEVKKLRKEGLSMQSIANEMKISKSKVVKLANL